MPDFELRAGPLRASVTTRGGCVLRFDCLRHDGWLPILRPFGGPDDGFRPTRCASFPLVPFGNRVRGGEFSYGGRSVSFRPNQPWFPEYLHGDGWVSEWAPLAAGERAVELAMSRRSDAVSPYAFAAVQRFALSETALEIAVSVANRGEQTLPFGIGHHPYFAWRAGTALRLGAVATFWEEGADFLPAVQAPIPDDLQFLSYAAPPTRRVNAVFGGWDGRASVRWPDGGGGWGVDMTASDVFRWFMLFINSPLRDPSYAYEYFCIEPMSHLAAGHGLPDAGFVPLEPGKRMSGSIRLALAV